MAEKCQECGCLIDEKLEARMDAIATADATSAQAAGELDRLERESRERMPYAERLLSDDRRERAENERDKYRGQFAEAEKRVAELEKELAATELRLSDVDALLTTTCDERDKYREQYGEARALCDDAVRTLQAVKRALVEGHS